MPSQAAASMLVLLAVATPVGGDASAWAQWGLAGLVVGFTLWRDHAREERLSRSMEAQQAWIRDTLTAELAANTAVLQEVALLLREQRS